MRVTCHTMAGVSARARRAAVPVDWALHAAVKIVCCGALDWRPLQACRRLANDSRTDNDSHHSPLLCTPAAAAAVMHRSGVCPSVRLFRLFLSSLMPVHVLRRVLQVLTKGHHKARMRPACVRPCCARADTIVWFSNTRTARAVAFCLSFFSRDCSRPTAKVHSK